MVKEIFILADVIVGVGKNILGETCVIHNNFSSWSEEVDYDELTEEASKYNLSFESLQGACDVLHRSTKKKLKKKYKPLDECWQ